MEPCGITWWRMTFADSTLQWVHDVAHYRLLVKRNRMSLGGWVLCRRQWRSGVWLTVAETFGILTPPATVLGGTVLIKVKSKLIV